MRSNFFQEVGVSVVLVILLVLLWNPFRIWIPDQLTLAIMAVIAVLFFLFASFIWREYPRDEREESHQLVAGRAGFLTGSALLTIGILVQSFQHKLDIWLVVTLSVMILGKAVTLVYNQYRR